MEINKHITDGKTSVKLGGVLKHLSTSVNNVTDDYFNVIIIYVLVLTITKRPAFFGGKMESINR